MPTDNCYPLDHELLNEEYETVMLKMALSLYLQKEGDAIRAEMEEKAYPPEQPDIRKFINESFCKMERKDAQKKLCAAAGKAVTCVAVFFLIAALSFTTAFAVSPSVRQAVYRLLFTETERYTEIHLDPQNASFIDPEIYTWEDSYAMTYLPEGYELDYCKRMVTLNVVMYKSGDKFIDFQQSSPDASVTVHVDTENATVTKNVTINGGDGIYNLKDGYVNIVWRQNGSLLTLLSNDESIDLMKVAEGIRAFQ